MALVVVFLVEDALALVDDLGEGLGPTSRGTVCDGCVSNGDDPLVTNSYHDYIATMTT